ncbi:olfactory receptor 11A1-like [Sphaerodactylus townsendi]|uniref:olfactory receptor 11A1-like n=1 Tax=Sphaerodactylus townsendi TaxID=933632 RepID=UPI002027403A|nr:olfactory receptor 11A1-like [Sphaerodactylus townsendi]
MAVGDRGSQTNVTELILLGFGDLQHLDMVLFLLFLVIYIFTMVGNILIIILVVLNHNLHTPMYFFLGNLSCLETFYTSTILPRLLVSFLTGEKTISIPGCIAQFYFFAALVVTECGLLAVMSYDRYTAICKPLHYATLMNMKACLYMASGSWINGFLAMSVMMYLMTRLAFCGSNEIDHFFCDLTPVARISCSEGQRFERMGMIFSTFFTLPPFLLTLTSYTFIIIAILKIPSATGRKKAFSTCSSHLIVVTIYYGTLITVYVLPNTDNLRKLNKVFSVFYTILTPLVNPLIYSLRNREVKETLRKSIGKLTHDVRAQKLKALSLE